MIQPAQHKHPKRLNDEPVENDKDIIMAKKLTHYGKPFATYTKPGPKKPPAKPAKPKPAKPKPSKPAKPPRAPVKKPPRKPAKQPQKVGIVEMMLIRKRKQKKRAEEILKR